MSEIYMMVTICNRKQMQKFVKFYKQITWILEIFLLPWEQRPAMYWITSDSRRMRKAFILSGHTSHLENREKGIADGTEN